MASSSKKKTTFAKLNREAAVRDRRLHKQAKRDARKLAAATAAAEPPIAPDGEELAAEELPDAAGPTDPELA